MLENEPAEVRGEREVSLGAPVAAMLSRIGATALARRKEMNYTLAELSALSGLSPAIISQIERGQANPSFSTLAQLAHGLDLPVGKFLPNHRDVTSPVVRRAERRDLRSVAPEGAGQEVFELLTPDLNGTIEAIWVVTPPGHDTRSTPFTHGGEEVGIVLSGQIDVWLDGVCHTLGEGDSITFDSTVPHWYENKYEETCTAIWVVSPPTW